MKSMRIDSVVERLAASRDQYFEALELEGDKLGYSWAAEVAEYFELERLASLEPDGHQIGIFSTPDEFLLAVTGWNGKNAEFTVPRECLENGDLCLDQEDLEEPAFWDGFLTGAERLYDEVRSRLSV